MSSETSLKEYLLNDPLSRFDRAIAQVEVNQRFSQFLPDVISPRDIGVLLPFVREIPWRFWDFATVSNALNLLEKDIDRSIQAIFCRRTSLDRGIENLFRYSNVLSNETTPGHDKSQSIVQVATEFFPEYLRWAEHIFRNLIEVYWSIAKKGSVEGKFRLRNASIYLSQKGSDLFLNGYKDEVRNAIAHGTFTFTGFGIEFGDNNPNSYSIHEFLKLFDELCRTSNALAIGILLFWIRNSPVNPNFKEPIPLSIIWRFAAGGLNRTGLTLKGLVESSTPLAGSQLHSAVKISMVARTQVLGECCRIAAHLLEAGVTNYDRFVIEIDHGKEVGSLAIIVPSKLEFLIKANASIDQLPLVFTETPLLWFDEKKWRTRLRIWQIIIKTSIIKFKQDLLESWRNDGVLIGKGRFRIREVENLGSQGIARIRIRAVLINPQDAESKIVINEIINELTKKGRRKFVPSKSKFSDSGINWRKMPVFIFIELFKVDGTLRWLRSGGWFSGNLVAVAEYNKGNQAPVFVDNPEELYKNIRIRYQIDKVKAKKSLDEFSQVIKDVYKNHLK